MLPASMILRKDTHTRGVGNDRCEPSIQREPVEQTFEGSRHSPEIQGFGEQRAITNFSARTRAEESTQLRVQGTTALRRLALEGPKRAELAFSVDQGLDVRRADGANQ